MAAWNHGAGGVMLLEGAPHPNAAKVYINWLLSRSTQERLAKAIGDNSRRTDVAPADLRTFPDPKRLHQYIRQDEGWVEKIQKAMELAQAWIK